ncbi:hypothetical protein Dvina_25145 [Dactylosporangium vinaceum]|uniref:Serine/threonine protein kinase n=1 Tax=Dactylosporangium vinaceum TaxID=53362 RepID=A0ABV5MDU7_9ACTN|nr:hypothetical protein [Dactylosporangium vinaceum]UAC01049.1 hypothetical protein Dvina_25145 [Dactylosporangium vinaceum]
MTNPRPPSADDLEYPQTLAARPKRPSGERGRLRQDEAPHVIFELLKARAPLAGPTYAPHPATGPDPVNGPGEVRSKPTSSRPAQPKWLRWPVIAVVLPLVAGVAVAARPWDRGSGSNSTQAHAVVSAVANPRANQSAPSTPLAVPGPVHGFAGIYEGEFRNLVIAGTRRSPYSNYVSLAETDVKNCMNVGLDERMMPGMFGACYSGLWNGEPSLTGQVTGGPVYFRNANIGGRLAVYGVEKDGSCLTQDYAAVVEGQGRPTYSGTWKCGNATRDHADFRLIQMSPSS